MAVIKGTKNADKLSGKDYIIENFIYGLKGNDELNGGYEADNFIWGGIGNDTLQGGGLRDILRGGAGDDLLIAYSSSDARLYGGLGNDDLIANGRGAFLDGGPGADRMRGSSGCDTYVVDNIHDVVDDRYEYDGDTVQSWINYTLGSNIDDLILLGGKRLSGTGNKIDNVIVGNSGANTLVGLAGDDRLTGGDGRDVLTGGVGADILKGGAGADRFDFNSLREAKYDPSIYWVYQGDVVYFSHADQDKIDLSDIDADTSLSGEQDFAWVNQDQLSADFTGEAGQLRLGKRILQGDVDGDGKADFGIKIMGDLTPADVIL